MACKFNGHLRCSDSDAKRLNGCQHCGWCPEVAQARVEQIRNDRAWRIKRAEHVKLAIKLTSANLCKRS